MTARTLDPDWDMPLPLNITPAGLANALFVTADEVHTAWQSCIDPSLVVAESVAQDGHTANYCRLVEQEYEEDGSEGIWHDWMVEVRIGEVFIAGHWRLPADGRGADWQWCNNEAQNAFTAACTLFGRRVGRTVFVEEQLSSGPPATRH